ncbi:uncharacterized protein BDW70DRAFT_69217 [Aspergillus foveolatus]|uniref:uncharacterized protein n=1 Tax=Aspergillus foveolatus TaxID=210207 RepID=UPI003CCDEB71
MLTLILTLTFTLLIPICTTMKHILERLLQIPLRCFLGSISSNKDNDRCPSSHRCTHLLSKITPYIFYKDTLARFYDPRYEPAFSNPKILHPDHEAVTANPAPGDGESRPVSPGSTSYSDTKTERVTGIAYEDYLTFLDNSASGSGISRRESEVRAFARYKQCYHEYLHEIASVKGMSVERAWEEIESRRWRWGLEENRVKRNGYRKERRCAIHIV